MERYYPMHIKYPNYCHKYPFRWRGMSQVKRVNFRLPVEMTSMVRGYIKESG